MGRLVSCTLGSIVGSGGDWIGRVMDVSGVEALRGASGGCVGRVYGWKAAARRVGVEENWREAPEEEAARLRQHERQTAVDVVLLARNLGAFILYVSLCVRCRYSRKISIAELSAFG